MYKYVLRGSVFIIDGMSLQTESLNLFASGEVASIEEEEVTVGEL
jgi:hypothetical protein